MHTLDFDFQTLQTEIEAAAKKAFQEIASIHPREDLCAFALYSDEGAMTVCPAINTSGHLREMQRTHPDDAAYYKFGTAEWRFEAGASEEFSRICTQVREEVLEKEEDEAWFTWFSENLYETCVKALEKLRREGVFGSDPDSDFLLMFAVSEGDISPETELARFTRLNGPSLTAEFKAWVATWAD